MLISVNKIFHSLQELKDWIKTANRTDERFDYDHDGNGYGYIVYLDDDGNYWMVETDGYDGKISFSPNPEQKGTYIAKKVDKVEIKQTCWRFPNGYMVY